MKIEEINYTSPHLATVKALGKKNTKTLGFLPEGAFDSYAKRHTILVALDPQQNCVGYLIYRISQDRAVIVHLCIDYSVQKKGVARKLVDKLYELKKDLLGLRVACRRDFPAHKVWPKLGFRAIADRPGRGKEHKPLTLWHRDHNHPDLFTTTYSPVKLRIVIDANIFFDLYNDKDKDTDSEESKALLADWLQEELELWVTDELWNEIDRNKDQGNRDRNRKRVNNFSRVRYEDNKFKESFAFLQPLLPSSPSDNDESDFRQLAQTIATGIQIFVTRDDKLLKRSDEFYKKFGVAILRPSELITQLDELRRETEYQPVRLAGTELTGRLVQKKDQDVLVRFFQHESLGERKTHFNRQIRPLLVDLKHYECRLTLAKDDFPLALVIYGRQNANTLHIPMFRIRQGELQPTLARFLVFRSIALAVEEGRNHIIISDSFLDNISKAVLQEDGFVEVEKTWQKMNLSFVGSAKQLALHLSHLATTSDQLGQLLHRIANALENDELIKQTIIDIERILWPAKILADNFPSFIVPIKPYFAQELFDRGLVRQTLFGNEKKLILNREGVYYRASKPAVLSAPGRILWYVSAEEGYQDVKSVRAYSRLDEVVIGKPKELFQRFRRLGFYEWSAVFKIAKENLNNDIMALRFSSTENFSKPISLKELQLILGNKTTIQGPFQVSVNHFAQIYQLGNQLLS